MQGRVRARGYAHRDRSGSLRTSVVVLFISIVYSACTPKPEVIIHARDKPVRVRVELALTPAEQERGLMYRQKLDANNGMLFVFAETEVHSFWMKNTSIPLDMIFIDKDGEIVGIVENAVPFTTSSRMVPHPSRYVLEVNAGFAAAQGIQAGQRVEMPTLSVAR